MANSLRRWRLRWHTTGAFRPFICSSLSSHVLHHLSLAQSLKGDGARLNFKSPAEAKAALAAEAAAAESGAGAEPTGDESDEDAGEQPSSDEAADAEIIMPVSKRQRLSASPFPSPPTAPPGAIRSHTVGLLSRRPLAPQRGRDQRHHLRRGWMRSGWMSVSLSIRLPSATSLCSWAHIRRCKSSSAFPSSLWNIWRACSASSKRRRARLCWSCPPSCLPCTRPSRRRAQCCALRDPRLTVKRRRRCCLQETGRARTARSSARCSWLSPSS